MFFPFFGALRQLLEHRHPDAEASIDYSVTPHGEYTRIFGNSGFDCIFGAAGFNRHLLHHWEPQLSYTCLADMEAYLQRTELAPLLAQHKTTYIKAFIALFRW